MFSIYLLQVPLFQQNGKWLSFIQFQKFLHHLFYLTLYCSMRPISILPILSRILERLVVSDFLNPSFLNLPPPLALSNQFAYRATSSTTCALISLLSYVSNLLIISPHVFVFSFDYSKAFDTLSHSCVASKLALMDLPDNIYNWFLNYLSNRTHCTLFKDVTSAPASINASVVQGSVLGPSHFNLNSCALHQISADNR